MRAITGDDANQAAIAQRTLAGAELVAIPLPALCELVWVLSRGYRIPPPDIAYALRRLMNAGNVALNRRAAEAGLAMLDAGGDFADAVIAYEGSWLGATMFVSFDRSAVHLLSQAGAPATLLS